MSLYGLGTASLYQQDLNPDLRRVFVDPSQVSASILSRMPSDVEEDRQRKIRISTGYIYRRQLIISESKDKEDTT